MAECDDRDRHRTARRITARRFPREKLLSDFDCAANPLVRRAVIAQLATSAAWVAQGEPLCWIGDSGTGKSHLLIGLSAAAAMAGHRVKYVLATKLVKAADERQSVQDHRPLRSNWTRSRRLLVSSRSVKTRKRSSLPRRPRSM